ncbi:MAG: chalcone isomerase family protein [Comamonadaceae bacterium]
MKKMAVGILLTGVIGTVHPVPGAATEVPAWRKSLPGVGVAGKATFTVWGLEIYAATLWIVPDFSVAQYANHEFAMELAYLRELDSAVIAKSSISEIRRQGVIDDAKLRAWEKSLRAVIPDVKRGDRITGWHRPGVGVMFFLNDHLLGEINDPEFAGRFFAIWLSPTTSVPKLRQALLASARP